MVTVGLKFTIPEQLQFIDLVFPAQVNKSPVFSFRRGFELDMYWITNTCLVFDTGLYIL